MHNRGVAINEDGMAVRNVVDDSPGSYSGGDYIEFDFNPCNNPADAWPIIAENGITLAFQDGNWWADNLAYWVDGVEWNIGGIIDKNPLRAAMIVFLMMKEGELCAHSGR